MKPMKRAADLIGDGWDASDVPPHLVPITIEVAVHDVHPALPPKTHRIQLERGGRPLTLADREPSWIAGEKEGWR